VRCEHPEDAPAVSHGHRLALSEQTCDLLHISQIADGGGKACLRSQQESGGELVLKSPSLSRAEVPVPKRYPWQSRLDHRLGPGVQPSFSFCGPGNSGTALWLGPSPSESAGTVVSPGK